MKTATHLSYAALRKLRREFAGPASLTESLILRGIEAELATRHPAEDDTQAVIGELEDGLEDMTRMRDEALAVIAEHEEAIRELRSAAAKSDIEERARKALS